MTQIVHTTIAPVDARESRIAGFSPRPPSVATASARGGDPCWHVARPRAGAHDDHALARMAPGPGVRSVATMFTQLISSRRRAGLACLTGAALTLAGCAVMGAAQATSDVPDDLFRAPLSHDLFVVFAVYAALVHLFVLAGVAGLQRSEAPGARRATRLGLGAVVAGTALLFVCEWATIPLVDQRESATSSTIVDACFGVATLLVTFGMLTAGIVLARDARRDSWRRYAPLVCGLLSVVVIPIQFSSAIWLGVGIYGLGYAVLGAALATERVGQRAPAVRAEALSAP
jgi:hypothetical protein